MAILLGNIVYDLDRCPQCGVATPLLSIVGKPAKHCKDSYSNVWWHFTAECSRCKRHVLFYGWSKSEQENSSIKIQDTFPSLVVVSEDLPAMARKFLQQAVESKHAPDGAVMLAASAIDAMLKQIGLREGSLYCRIELAHENGTLTKQMRDWAHEIRLSANEPRHADDSFEGATAEDAEQIIEFANALGEYLFLLPARVQKWKAAAQSDKRESV